MNDHLIPVTPSAYSYPLLIKQIWTSALAYAPNQEIVYLQITDRLKDVIKMGGEWISSLEIENLLSQHPAVSEVAVIGVPDDKWGEHPLALVVPKPGTVVIENDIRTFLSAASDAGTISRYAILVRVMIVGEIAKTSVGKINKRALREKFGATV